MKFKLSNSLIEKIKEIDCETYGSARLSRSTINKTLNSITYLKIQGPYLVNYLHIKLSYNLTSCLYVQITVPIKNEIFI